MPLSMCWVPCILYALSLFHRYGNKYHHAFYDAGAITIVMEYMDGGSLLQVRLPCVSYSLLSTPPFPRFR